MGRIGRRWGVTVVAALLVSVLPGDARAIIGGSDDGNDHPNVGLIVALDSAGQLAELCTGTLVGPTVVLTAAHCVAKYDLGLADRFFVTFNPRPLDDGRLLDDAIAGTPSRDPRFQFGGDEKAGSAAFYDNTRYDVGVLVLDRPAGVTPALLPPNGMLDQYRTGTRNRSFTVVGYGVQRSGPPGQPDSYFIDYTRRTTTSPLMKLTDTLLYTQGVSKDARGGGGICSGDSGGPIFSGATIVAVNSFANTNCQNADGGPRLDTDVTRSFLNNFIDLR